MLEHVTIRLVSLFIQSGLCQTVFLMFAIHKLQDLDGVTVSKQWR